MTLWRFLSTALAAVGRKANYAAIIERLKAEPDTSDAQGLRIDEMIAQSGNAKAKHRKSQEAKKAKKKKNPEEKTVTVVYKTRRKTIIKKKKIKPS